MILRDILDGLGSRNLLEDIILVASEDADHDLNFDAVIQRLPEHRVTISFEKLELKLDQLQFTGLPVSTDAVIPSQSKVPVLLTFPLPRAINIFTPSSA